MTAHSSHAVLPLALVAGTMVLAVAACGGAPDPTPSASGSASSGSGATSPTPASSSSAAGPTTPAASPSGSATSGSGAGGTGCAVTNLKITYADDAGGAGAGSVMGTLTFANTGSSACTLTGFPGVSYVGGGNGTQVGQAATRTDGTAKTRTVGPGTSVKAALRRTQPRNYGDACREAKVDGLRVYPPGSTASAFVAFPTTGCKGAEAPLLQVGPVG